jgi:hypothetical protein
MKTQQAPQYTYHCLSLVQVYTIPPKSGVETNEDPAGSPVHGSLFISGVGLQFHLIQEQKLLKTQQAPQYTDLCLSLV